MDLKGKIRLRVANPGWCHIEGVSHEGLSLLLDISPVDERGLRFPGQHELRQAIEAAIVDAVNAAADRAQQAALPRVGDPCPEYLDGCRGVRCCGVVCYEDGQAETRSEPGAPPELFCSECGATWPLDVNLPLVSGRPAVQTVRQD